MNWNNPVALDVLAFAVGLNDDSAQLSSPGSRMTYPLKYSQTETQARS